LRSPNIDHRLRQLDFRTQGGDAAFPNLGLKIADVAEGRRILASVQSLADFVAGKRGVA